MDSTHGPTVLILFAPSVVALTSDGLALIELKNGLTTKFPLFETSTVLVHRNFWSEIETVGNAKHRNKVRLVGFVKWGKVGLLLHDYVLNVFNVFNEISIRFCTRVKPEVMMSMSSHGKTSYCGWCGPGNNIPSPCNPSIVHRHTKSSNVLNGLYF
ncbi:hypothetical protein KC19_12G133200 [Ceratodon purpureus]|uniref:Uncharacterized protein n=1 Tax=Ceratodon purpureus TaxID=3225 RepID=A0A8T0GAT7_CERPU|nr:hypothetical protein KC19_12G133200 [Ceratodon purpureus]